jgi:hypothetical protein
MAKEKKQKRVPRKKNKAVVKTDPGPEEYGGWKLGDLVYWCLSTEATPRYGSILKFHPNDNVGPAVSLSDLSGGGQRVALVQFIFETKKEAKESRLEFVEFWQNHKAQSLKKKRSSLKK